MHLTHKGSKFMLIKRIVFLFCLLLFSDISCALSVFYSGLLTSSTGADIPTPIAVTDGTNTISSNDVVAYYPEYPNSTPVNLSSTSTASMSVDSGGFSLTSR